MKATHVVGWMAVLLVTLVSSFWAFWGINEAFHEGWCKPQLWMRCLQVLAYITPATVLCVLTVLALRWPWLGAMLFALVGLTIAVLIVLDGANFGYQTTALLTAIPIGVGLLFFFGRPSPKWLAYRISVGLPLAIILSFGVVHAVTVSTRFDDGDRGERIVEGNGVTLVWAPAGPGWTRRGLIGWEEAAELASRLSEDGKSLADEPLNIWRLPTREEVVCSLTRKNKNAGGQWDADRQQATYDRRPDKESPLWDPFGPLIYLWTSEQESDNRAWIVVYHGGIYAKPKVTGSPSFGFRAVRELRENEKGD